MARSSSLPEGVASDDRVVLFDGVCNLCNRWAQFLIARDPHGRLRLAAAQSRTGQAILAWRGLPTDRFDTMVFVEEGEAYIKSEAFLRVVRHLPRPWPWLRLGVVIPRPMRDWLYDRVALNRFDLFGRSETCMVPGPDLALRFLP